MWILDELRCLQELLVKNIRRLVHLLSTTARKACIDIIDLVKKYYNLLFADTPTRAHQRMVDFNRWVAEILADTRTDGIEWGPSYGEKPWLALEDQQLQNQPLEQVLRPDSADTIQLLKTACEYYMQRGDRLLQTNAGLAAQIEELKTQLQAAFTRAFEAQQALHREKELSVLQVRRHVMGVQLGDYFSRGEDPEDFARQMQNTFRMVDAVSTVPLEGADGVTGSDSTLASGLGRDINQVEVENASVDDRRVPGDIEDINSEAATSAYQEQAPPTPASENVKVRQTEVLRSSKHLVMEPTVSSVVMATLSDSDDSDYQQLAQVSASEQNDGTWYRQALRSLKEKRERRRLQCNAGSKTAKETGVAAATAHEATKTILLLDVHNPREYEQLAATRDPAEDGEDSTWYRRALEHLKRERKLRRNRAESFSSTIID
ncbi:hypothetical protein PRIC1_013017 [Phytophthora ramorum]